MSEQRGCDAGTVLAPLHRAKGAAAFLEGFAGGDFPPIEHRAGGLHISITYYSLGHVRFDQLLAANSGPNPGAGTLDSHANLGTLTAKGTLTIDQVGESGITLTTSIPALLARSARPPAGRPPPRNRM